MSLRPMPVGLGLVVIGGLLLLILMILDPVGGGIALAAFAALELLGAGYYWRHRGRLVWLDVPGRIVTRTPEDLNDDARPRLKLHPYFGYVSRPGQMLAQVSDLQGYQREMGLADRPDWWDRTFSNNHGLFGEQNFPVMKTDERQFIVGIFGGSVAAAFALEERGAIGQVVRGVPGYEDRDVLVLDFAMGGFHQPAQLFVLNYMLTLGQTFDLIINLDGFNEAFCGWDNAENFKTHVSMPNAWFIFGQQNEFVSKRSYGNTRAILAARARLRRLEKEMLGARSALYFYVLRSIWELIQRRTTQIESDYSKPHADRDYPVYLLPQERLGLSEVAREIADIWARSIFQTKAVADLIGAPFIQMLQPSQYYGSRVFSEEERRIAFVDPPFYGAGIVPHAYDAMRAYAATFASMGIRFVDTTAAFDNYAGPFYHDAVCHINRRGMDVILNEFLAYQIKHALQISRERRN